MKSAHSYIINKYCSVAWISSFVILAFAAVAAYFKQYILATTEGFVFILLLVYILIINTSWKKATSKYLKKLSENSDGIPENMLMSVPIPMTICSIDGTISWYNNLFTEIFNEKKLPNKLMSDCITQIKWSEVLKFPNGKDLNAEIGDKSYTVTWKMVKDKTSQSNNNEHYKIGEQYSVFFYLFDNTSEINMKTAYTNERIDVAVVSVDNYDDFLQKNDDDVIESTASKIRNLVWGWAKDANAILKKTDRDRFFAAFEHQFLTKYTDSNFDIIKKMEVIAKEVNFPISISIGIGTGDNISENEISARHALDLALGRGGGQVCIKDKTQFRFYGGKSGEFERSTRVKARAVSAALVDFIKNSDNVILMGHKSADFDCFGAAIGLQRAVRELGKTPYIVYERHAPAIYNMYNSLKDNKEYIGMFVDENEVLEEVTPNTLLVVLDTHRPSMLPCKRLLDNVSKVILIDHHRRSTEFISPLSLIYHEPYASSTCEMVTELLEYMNISESITKIEAQCLYTGILLDTKNFMLKTGVRTFEAASYLRKMGLDTISVRRMFSTSKTDYTMKTEIVKSAELVNDKIAIAKTYTSDRNMRQIASQAADDMLNLENVEASVVVYPAEGGTGFSARSIGTVNVQLIMEKLGGGGHMTVSGAFLKNIGIDKGVQKAKDAINSYLEDIK